MIFSAYIASVLSTYLGRFLRGLNKDSIKVSLLKGSIELKKLELSPQILSFSKLLKLKQGTIGSLKVSIPWRSLYSKRCEVEIKDVTISVSVGFSGENTANTFFASEDEFCAAAKAVIAEEVRGTISPHDDAGDKSGVFWRLRQYILKNLAFRCVNVVVKIEDPSGCWEGNTSALQAKLESIEFEATDDTYRPVFVSPKNDIQNEIAYRLISYRNCSVQITIGRSVYPPLDASISNSTEFLVNNQSDPQMEVTTTEIFSSSSGVVTARYAYDSDTDQVLRRCAVSGGVIIHQATLQWGKECISALGALFASTKLGSARNLACDMRPLRRPEKGMNAVNREWWRYGIRKVIDARLLDQRRKGFDWKAYLKRKALLCNMYTCCLRELEAPWISCSDSPNVRRELLSQVPTEDVMTCLRVAQYLVHQHRMNPLPSSKCASEWPISYARYTEEERDAAAAAFEKKSQDVLEVVLSLECPSVTVEFGSHGIMGIIGKVYAGTTLVNGEVGFTQMSIRSIHFSTSEQGDTPFLSLTGRDECGISFRTGNMSASASPESHLTIQRLSICVDPDCRKKILDECISLAEAALPLMEIEDSFDLRGVVRKNSEKQRSAKEPASKLCLQATLHHGSISLDSVSLEVVELATFSCPSRAEQSISVERIVLSVNNISAAHLSSITAILPPPHERGSGVRVKAERADIVPDPENFELIKQTCFLLKKDIFSAVGRVERSVRTCSNGPVKTRQDERVVSFALDVHSIRYGALILGKFTVSAQIFDGWYIHMTAREVSSKGLYQSKRCSEGSQLLSIDLWADSYLVDSPFADCIDEKGVGFLCVFDGISLCFGDELTTTIEALYDTVILLVFLEEDCHVHLQKSNRTDTPVLRGNVIVSNSCFFLESKVDTPSEEPLNPNAPITPSLPPLPPDPVKIELMGEKCLSLSLDRYRDKQMLIRVDVKNGINAFICDAPAKINLLQKRPRMNFSLKLHLCPPSQKELEIFPYSRMIMRAELQEAAIAAHIPTIVALWTQFSRATLPLWRLRNLGSRIHFSCRESRPGKHMPPMSPTSITATNIGASAFAKFPPPCNSFTTDISCYTRPTFPSDLQLSVNVVDSEVSYVFGDGCVAPLFVHSFISKGCIEVSNRDQCARVAVNGFITFPRVVASVEVDEPPHFSAGKHCDSDGDSVSCSNTSENCSTHDNSSGDDTAMAPSVTYKFRTRKDAFPNVRGARSCAAQVDNTGIMDGDRLIELKATYTNDSRPPFHIGSSDESLIVSLRGAGGDSSLPGPYYGCLRTSTEVAAWLNLFTFFNFTNTIAFNASNSSVDSEPTVESLYFSPPLPPPSGNPRRLLTKLCVAPVTLHLPTFSVAIVLWKGLEFTASPGFSQYTVPCMDVIVHGSLSCHAPKLSGTTSTQKKSSSLTSRKRVIHSPAACSFPLGQLRYLRDQGYAIVSLRGQNDRTTTSFSACNSWTLRDGTQVEQIHSAAEEVAMILEAISCGVSPPSSTDRRRLLLHQVQCNLRANTVLEQIRRCHILDVISDLSVVVKAQRALLHAVVLERSRERKLFYICRYPAESPAAVRLAQRLSMQPPPLSIEIRYTNVTYEWTSTSNSHITAGVSLAIGGLTYGPTAPAPQAGRKWNGIPPISVLDVATMEAYQWWSSTAQRRTREQASKPHHHADGRPKDGVVGRDAEEGEEAGARENVVTSIPLLLEPVSIHSRLGTSNHLHNAVDCKVDTYTVGNSKLPTFCVSTTSTTPPEISLESPVELPARPILYDVSPVQLLLHTTTYTLLSDAILGKGKHDPVKDGWEVTTDGVGDKQCGAVHSADAPIAKETSANASVWSSDSFNGTPGQVAHSHCETCNFYTLIACISDAPHSVYWEYIFDVARKEVWREDSRADDPGWVKAAEAPLTVEPVALSRQTDIQGPLEETMVLYEDKVKPSDSNVFTHQRLADFLDEEPVGFSSSSTNSRSHSVNLSPLATATQRSLEGQQSTQEGSKVLGDTVPPLYSPHGDSGSPRATGTLLFSTAEIATPPKVQYRVCIADARLRLLHCCGGTGGRTRDEQLFWHHFVSMHVAIAVKQNRLSLLQLLAVVVPSLDRHVQTWRRTPGSSSTKNRNPTVTDLQVLLGDRCEEALRFCITMICITSYTDALSVAFASAVVSSSQLSQPLLMMEKVELYLPFSTDRHAYSSTEHAGSVVRGMADVSGMQVPSATTSAVMSRQTTTPSHSLPVPTLAQRLHRSNDEALYRMSKERDVQDSTSSASPASQGGREENEPLSVVVAGEVGCQMDSLVVDVSAAAIHAWFHSLVELPVSVRRDVADSAAIVSRGATIPLKARVPLDDDPVVEGPPSAIQWAPGRGLKLFEVRGPIWSVDHDITLSRDGLVLFFTNQQTNLHTVNLHSHSILLDEALLERPPGLQRTVIVVESGLTVTLVGGCVRLPLSTWSTTLLERVADVGVESVLLPFIALGEGSYIRCENTRLGFVETEAFASGIAPTLVAPTPSNEANKPCRIELPPSHTQHLHPSTHSTTTAAPPSLMTTVIHRRFHIVIPCVSLVVKTEHDGRQVRIQTETELWTGHCNGQLLRGDVQCNNLTITTASAFDISSTTMTTLLKPVCVNVCSTKDRHHAVSVSPIQLDLGRADLLLMSAYVGELQSLRAYAKHLMDTVEERAFLELVETTLSWRSLGSNIGDAGHVGLERNHHGGDEDSHGQGRRDGKDTNSTSREATANLWSDTRGHRSTPDSVVQGSHVRPEDCDRSSRRQQQQLQQQQKQHELSIVVFAPMVELIVSDHRYPLGQLCVEDVLTRFISQPRISTTTTTLRCQKLQAKVYGKGRWDALLLPSSILSLSVNQMVSRHSSNRHISIEADGIQLQCSHLISTKLLYVVRQLTTLSRSLRRRVCVARASVANATLSGMATKVNQSSHVRCDGPQDDSDSSPQLSSTPLGNGAADVSSGISTSTVSSNINTSVDDSMGSSSNSSTDSDDAPSDVDERFADQPSFSLLPIPHHRSTVAATATATAAAATHRLLNSFCQSVYVELCERNVKLSLRSVGGSYHGGRESELEWLSRELHHIPPASFVDVFIPYRRAQSLSFVFHLESAVTVNSKTGQLQLCSKQSGCFHEQIPLSSLRYGMAKMVEVSAEPLILSCGDVEEEREMMRYPTVCIGNLTTLGEQGGDIRIGYCEQSGPGRHQTNVSELRKCGTSAEGCSSSSPGCSAQPLGSQHHHHYSFHRTEGGGAFSSEGLGRRSVRASDGGLLLVRLQAPISLVNDAGCIFQLGSPIHSLPSHDTTAAGTKRSVEAWGDRGVTLPAGWQYPLRAKDGLDVVLRVWCPPPRRVAPPFVAPPSAPVPSAAGGVPIDTAHPERSNVSSPWSGWFETQISLPTLDSGCFVTFPKLHTDPHDRDHRELVFFVVVRHHANGLSRRVAFFPRLTLVNHVGVPLRVAAFQKDELAGPQTADEEMMKLAWRPDHQRRDREEFYGSLVSIGAHPSLPHMHSLPIHFCTYKSNLVLGLSLTQSTGDEIRTTELSQAVSHLRDAVDHHPRMLRMQDSSGRTFYVQVSVLARTVVLSVAVWVHNLTEYPLLMSDSVITHRLSAGQTANTGVIPSQGQPFLIGCQLAEFTQAFFMIGMNGRWSGAVSVDVGSSGVFESYQPELGVTCSCNYTISLPNAQEGRPVVIQITPRWLFYNDTRKRLRLNFRFPGLAKAQSRANSALENRRRQLQHLQSTEHGTLPTSAAPESPAGSASALTAAESDVVASLASIAAVQLNPGDYHVCCIGSIEDNSFSVQEVLDETLPSITSITNDRVEHRDVAAYYEAQPTPYVSIDQPGEAMFNLWATPRAAGKQIAVSYAGDLLVHRPPQPHPTLLEPLDPYTTDAVVTGRITVSIQNTENVLAVVLQSIQATKILIQNRTAGETVAVRQRGSRRCNTVPPRQNRFFLWEDALQEHVIRVHVHGHKGHWFEVDFTHGECQVTLQRWKTFSTSQSHSADPLQSSGDGTTAAPSTTLSTRQHGASLHDDSFPFVVRSYTNVEKTRVTILITDSAVPAYAAIDSWRTSYAMRMHVSFLKLWWMREETAMVTANRRQRIDGYNDMSFFSMESGGSANRDRHSVVLIEKSSSTFAMFSVVMEGIQLDLLDTEDNKTFYMELHQLQWCDEMRRRVCLYRARPNLPPSSSAAANVSPVSSLAQRRCLRRRGPDTAPPAFPLSPTPQQKIQEVASRLMGSLMNRNDSFLQRMERRNDVEVSYSLIKYADGVMRITELHCVITPLVLVLTDFWLADAVQEAIQMRTLLGLRRRSLSTSPSSGAAPVIMLSNVVGGSGGLGAALTATVSAATFTTSTLYTKRRESKNESIPLWHPSTCSIVEGGRTTVDCSSGSHDSPTPLNDLAVHRPLQLLPTATAATITPFSHGFVPQAVFLRRVVRGLQIQLAEYSIVGVEAGSLTAMTSAPPPSHRYRGRGFLSLTKHGNWAVGRRESGGRHGTPFIGGHGSGGNVAQAHLSSAPSSVLFIENLNIDRVTLYVTFERHSPDPLRPLLGAYAWMLPSELCQREFYLPALLLRRQVETSWSLRARLGKWASQSLRVQWTKVTKLGTLLDLLQFWQYRSVPLQGPPQYMTEMRVAMLREEANGQSIPFFSPCSSELSISEDDGDEQELPDRAKTEDKDGGRE